MSSSPCVFMDLGFRISGSSRINTLIKLTLLVETEEEDDDEDEADVDQDDADPSHEVKEEDGPENEADPTEGADNDVKSGKVFK